MRLVLAFIVVCVSGLATAQTNAGISHEFKTKAWRALDAIKRTDLLAIPISSNGPSMVDQLEERLEILDADKAVAETKYEASNAVEKHYADVLDWAVSEREIMVHWAIGDPQWKFAAHLEAECEVEVKALIVPEEIGYTQGKDTLPDNCIKDAREQGKK